MGDPYTLPFAESVPQGGSKYVWTEESTGRYATFQAVYADSYNAVTAQDDDNGMFKFDPYEVGDATTLTSGLISLADAAAPYLSFYYYAKPGTNTLDAAIIDQDGNPTNLWHIDMAEVSDEGWTPVQLQLKPWAGQSPVRIAFTATSGSGFGEYTYIDNIVVDESDGLPFSRLFDTDEELADFTVIDANGDGTTWTNSTFIGYEQMLMIRYNQNMAMDDWLITPSFRLKEGQSYKFSFTTCCDYPNYPERLEAFCGHEATVEGQTIRLLEPTVIDWDGLSRRTLSAIVTIEETGSYCFSIHGISDAYMFDLYVDDIRVEAYSTEVPAAATDLTAQTAAKGQLPVTIGFTAPTLTAGGEQLESITRMVISRGGEQIGTVEATPGARLTYDDYTAKEGTNTYTLQAENKHGMGLEATVSVYVGDDLEPMPVRNLTATETAPGHVRVEWQAPGEVGLSGGYVNPDDVRYNVWREQDGSYVQIANGISECYVEDDVEMTMQQMALTYLVRDYNDNPLSYSRASVDILIGESYELPLRESVAGGNAQTLWVTGDHSYMGYWYAVDEMSVPTQDEDGGYFVFQPLEDGDYATLLSGRISLEEAVAPVLTFHYYARKGQNRLSASVVDMDGETQTVFSTEMADVQAEGWQKVTLPLTDWAGKARVRLAFTAEAPQAYEYCYIDNIVLKDTPADDVALVGLAAPELINVGRPETLTATVENSGRNEAKDFSVVLLRDGEETARQTVATLAAGEKTEVTFADELSFDAASTVEYQAIVEYAEDGDAENNASAIVQVEVNRLTDLPRPQALTLAAGNKLMWQAPETYTETVEGFEDYEPFAISHLAPWSLFDGNGSGTVMANGSRYNPDGTTQYANAGQAAAWMVFNPEASGIANCDITCHEGSQVLAAFAADKGSNDGWITSPRMAEGQTDEGDRTVRLYARAANPDFPETLQMLYSTTGRAIADFDEVDTYTLDSYDWTEIEEVLPTEARYFALRCISTDCYALLIDDISYRSQVADATLTGYRLYCDGRLIVTLDATTTATTLTGDAVSTTAHTYQLTALYDMGESQPALLNGEATGISGHRAATAHEAVYDAQGRRLTGVSRGLNIVREADGNVRKVMKK